jgi:hypothetical protein
MCRAPLVGGGRGRPAWTKPCIVKAQKLEIRFVMTEYNGMKSFKY